MPERNKVFDKWFQTKWGNFVLNKIDTDTKKEYYISYNEKPPGESCVETALCVGENDYYTTNKDLRKEYEKCNTLEECMLVHEKHKEHRSIWSTDSDECIKDIPKTLEHYYRLEKELEQRIAEGKADEKEKYVLSHLKKAIELCEQLSK